MLDASAHSDKLIIFHVSVLETNLDIDIWTDSTDTAMMCNTHKDNHFFCNP